MSQIQVQDEFREAAAVLSSAFNHAGKTNGDRFCESLTGGNKVFGPLLHQAHLRAGAIGGEVWAAGFEGSSEICAVAQIKFGDNEEQRAAGWNLLQAKFPPNLKAWWSKFGSDYSTWSKSCRDKEQDENFKDMKLQSWQLQLLGTSPDHQGKGLASQLIQVKDEPSVGMCLEATNLPNVEFYKGKCGFSVRGKPLKIIGPEITPDAPRAETEMFCLSKNLEIWEK
ncbi:hypothetical protein DFH07DRAFT_950318 [Mycena maculata]|uniref:N-acetyltransferase domain-containing protein n=1 Tax=Mycena maculata TaxID=230809 RepID=A0AAD7NXV9_9AGAR|nr:hypothetical protein DFH07DRAFT_950318 [Mycena maculata]